MAKIDAFLETMAQRKADRAVLLSDKPIQIFCGSQKLEGAMIPAAQLCSLMDEVIPALLRPQLSADGSFHFLHHSPHGAFDFGVETFVGVMTVHISPSK